MKLEVALLFLVPVTANTFVGHDRGDDGLIDGLFFQSNTGGGSGRSSEEFLDPAGDVEVVGEFAAEVAGHCDAGSGEEEGDAVDAGGHGGFGVVDEFGNEGEPGSKGD